MRQSGCSEILLEIMRANNFTGANHYRFGIVDLKVIQPFFVELLHHSHAVITTILKSNCKPQAALPRVYITCIYIYSIHHIDDLSDYHDDICHSKSNIHVLASFNYILYEGSLKMETC